MLFKKYIKDAYKGISLGLEYPYRAIKIKNRYLIYRISDGKIIEKLPKEKINSINEHNAIKRLHKWNRLEIGLNPEVKNNIDNTN